MLFKQELWPLQHFVHKDLQGLPASSPFAELLEEPVNQGVEDVRHEGEHEPVEYDVVANIDVPLPHQVVVQAQFISVVVQVASRDCLEENPPEAESEDVCLKLRIGKKSTSMVMMLVVRTLANKRLTMLEDTSSL